jgi:hypothetical protein
MECEQFPSPLKKHRRTQIIGVSIGDVGTIPFAYKTPMVYVRQCFHR